jgi:hypothetical protein
MAILLVVVPAAHPATVTADFGQRVTPKLKLGFLHNLSATAPSDDLLLPLKPTAWRSNERSAPAHRVHALGATQTIVLSDHWSYPVHGWRHTGPPWTKLERYEDWVRQFARRYKGQGLHYWDIWNEPDYNVFWDGTRSQYYETFATAERVLREELGSEARIVGPSTTRWQLGWIEGLAEFCLKRGCRFDAVSWHDLPNDMRSLPQLSDRIERTRALLSQSRYRPVGVRELHVNEIMGEDIQFKPGAAVGYFSELERGEADIAIKSCWPDSSGRVNCQGQTLDGLLDWDSGRPRALWYTWRAYADGRSSRVRSHSRNARIAVLASRRSRLPGHAQLLLGNLGSERRGVKLRSCGLSALTSGRSQASRAAILIERHPDFGEAVFTPSPDDRPYRLTVDDDGDCASGWLPVPSEGGALLAYIRVR